MSFWSKSEDEFSKMDRLIRAQPGIRLAELARQLGVTRSTIQRRLPSLDEAGYRYWEDENGGLWPMENS